MDTSGNWRLGLTLDSINYWQLGEQPARDEEPNRAGCPHDRPRPRQGDDHFGSARSR